MKRLVVPSVERADGAFWRLKRMRQVAGRAEGKHMDSICLGGIEDTHLKCKCNKEHIVMALWRCSVVIVDILYLKKWAAETAPQSFQFALLRVVAIPALVAWGMVKDQLLSKENNRYKHAETTSTLTGRVIFCREASDQNTIYQHFPLHSSRDS